MVKTIGFITAGLKFNGHTVNEKALGGSESALIYMAREMAKLGNAVTVYCECDSPGWYDGVEYRTVDQYTKDNKAQFDTLIVSRFTDFLALPVDSKMNILWCHDIDTNNFRDAIGCTDRVFCLSDFHKSLFVKNYDIEPTNYVWKTSNGYDQDIVTEYIPYEQKKNNYIYASRPERGLKLLLEKIWPDIVERNPDAVLHICTYEHTMGLPDDVKKIHKEVENLLEYSRNIKHIGHLPKRQFYELLSTCAYMVYPTEFPEISCINAIEAQYNGCLVITTDKFAMSETVKSKTKVKANPQLEANEYVEEFLSYIDTYKDEKFDEEALRCKKIIESTYSWAHVAKSWNNEIDFMFNRRYEKYKDKIVDQLVYNSDVVAAWKLTNDQKYRDMLDQAAKDNVSVSDFTPIVKDEDAYLGGRGLQLIELVQNEIDMFPTKKLKILDLGSNDGILSLPLMKRFSNNIESLTMYDSSKDCLDWVKSQYKTKYPQIDYIVDNVSNVLSYDLQPDIVLVGELLEHVEDTQEFLSFLMKLANKNTLFYFTVPHGPWENIINRKELFHIHHFELNDLQAIFKNVDLAIGKNPHHTKGRRGEMCSNWMFWFTASKGDNIEFGKVDYQDKWIKTRPYKKISTCMIVCNEEDNLSRCLKTVRDFSDEIIIVDTGSTDDTKQIARKFTDNVYDLKWEEEDGLGNFSTARNYSISLATGDYIFWIDADEQLENGQLLHKYIISDYYDGILLRQVQAMSKKAHANGVNVDVMHDRFFRNNIGIQFTGVIHEYPSRDDEHFLGNKMFWQDHIYVIHYGLANQETLKRKALGRNADLIYKNVKTYPKRTFARHYIMVDYWSQFITGHPNPDMTWLQKGMDIWHNDLKNCGDDWTTRLSLGVLQHYYAYCAENGIAFKGKLPEKVAFQNGTNGETIDFYVVNPEEESDFFLKYLANFKRP